MEDIAEIEHSKEWNQAGKVVLFDSVVMECGEEGFIPDLTCYDAGKKLFIEIVVTNDVSEEKIERVKQLNIPMMAIYVSDLNGMDDLSSLTEAVLKLSPRKWIYHPMLEHEEAKLTEELSFDISIINERMRLAVLEELNFDDNKQSIAPKNHQVLLLGYNSAYGYSRKKGRDFDFSMLFVTKPIGGNSSANYCIRANGGYEVDKIGFDETLLPQLEEMSFPCIVELGVKGVFAGGKRLFLVDSIQM